MFKNKAKKAFYKGLIDKIQRSIWDMELRIITISEIREGIRLEFDRISGTVKSLEEQILEAKDEVKRNLEEKLKAYKEDQENLQTQMVGKWNEKEQAYVNGIDQEINAVKEKIQGAKEFQGLIKRELKKL